MVPSVAHFVWLGRSFPWMMAVALHAARARGGFARVVLHHTDDLDAKSLLACQRELSFAELSRLDPERLLVDLGSPATRLIELWRRLSKPAAKSNLLRLAILAKQGGVYLDTDVIAVRSFAPLLDTGAFCGAERIALPAGVARSRNPVRWVGPLARLVARDLFRRLPDGHRWFRAVEARYPAVVNNAVLGAEPGHPFITHLLDAMVGLPVARQTVRFALGTHLLETELRRARPADLRVHPPEIFYPLAPEISEHWFRVRKVARLADALFPETVAVHWYASVRTRQIVARVDADYVRAHADHQLWSALVLPLLSPDNPVGAPA